MESEITSNQSPLAGLYRSTRQRRSSPLAATRSRRGSPLSYTAPDPPFPPPPARNPLTTSYDKFDDSDDEGKAPQLSALARMLLDEFPEPGLSETKKEEEYEKEKQEKADEGLRRSPLSRYSISRKRITWSQSPDPEERSGSATRTGSSQGSSRRFGTSRDGSPDRPTGQEFVTPAAVPRYSRRAYSSGQYSRAEGPGSAGDIAAHEDQPETRHHPNGYATAVRPGPGTVGGLPPSTTASAMRWKRAGRGLLGPVGGAPRRGPRRESDPSDVDEERRDNEGIPERNSSSPEEVGGRESNNGVMSHSRMGSASPTSGGEKETSYDPEPIPTISRRPRRASPESLSGQYQMNVYHSASPEVDIGHSADNAGSASPVSAMSRAAATIATTPAPALAPQTKSDKENMPPPAFRRPAVAASSYKRLDNTLEKPPPPVFQAPSVLPPKMEPLAPASPPPEKRALAAKTSNTPLRPVRQAPPPPPPKMSMLEAVTATAGAAATKTSQNTRRNRSTVTINGKPYRRLDAIGKGGSCKVYKVMAENHKMFAMKKVTFHEQDGPAAILGYKGEIDLLKRLSGEERVIRLYDFEMNEEKQTLTMLMECGETDFANILTLRHGNEDSQLDVSFVRYYWREMLQCVDIVHQYNVIHSDLKPANFLLVRGKLKLIDFGIANAIQDDTVNVHRESQVGTLNYMSPEAIVDINASSGKPMASVGQPRLMKLGAPSDVWSLGCILYQMTYGRTPFYHLTSMYQKIAAIPDPNHPIDYPSTGIGGVKVPRSLINTIKGCLERDKEKRPTIRQLLSAEDPFLNPDSKPGVVEITEDMLLQLLENAADTVEANGKPSTYTLQTWAKDVFAKLERRMDTQRPGYR